MGSSGTDNRIMDLITARLRIERLESDLAATIADRDEIMGERDRLRRAIGSRVAPVEIRKLKQRIRDLESALRDAQGERDLYRAGNRSLVRLCKRHDIEIPG